MTPRHWREGDYGLVVFEGEYEASYALVVIDEAVGTSGPPLRGLLLDLTESNSFRSRSAHGLRTVAQFLASRQERFSRRLALVGGTDLAYGLLRMGIVYVSDQGIHGEVFRDRDRALAWLRAASSGRSA